MSDEFVYYTVTCTFDDGTTARYEGLFLSDLLVIINTFDLINPVTTTITREP